MNSEETNLTPDNKTEATTIITSPGRPVDPTSKRQMRLKELEDKKNDPTFKLGRPSNPESKRQQQIKEKETKQASGYITPKGRPKMTDEQKIAARIKREEHIKNLLAKHTPLTMGEQKEVDEFNAENADLNILEFTPEVVVMDTTDENITLEVTIPSTEEDVVTHVVLEEVVDEVAKTKKGRKK